MIASGTRVHFCLRTLTVVVAVRVRQTNVPRVRNERITGPGGPTCKDRGLVIRLQANFSPLYEKCAATCIESL